MKRTLQIFQAMAIVLVCSVAGGIGRAQEARPQTAPAPGMQQGPRVVSPEVSPDRRIVFRILAPQDGRTARQRHPGSAARRPGIFEG